MKKIITIVVVLTINVFQLYSQKELDLEHKISIEALNYLKENNINGFKSLFDENILNGIDKSTFDKYTRQANEILSSYEIPDSDNLMIETSQVKHKGEYITLNSINFPFSHSANPGILSDYQIIFVFSKEVAEGKIIAMKIRDLLSPGKKLVDEAKKEPHLQEFDFNVKNIKWFRIWYNSGFSNNKVGGNNIYALSGDYEKLKKAKINKSLNDIFKLLNNAEIEKTEYKYELQRTIGNPEYLYLRLTFENYPYKDFKEFSIFTILSGENGVNKPNAGYIVIKHSDVFKYYIRIRDNQELYENLKKLAYVNHGELLEVNP